MRGGNSTSHKNRQCNETRNFLISNRDDGSNILAGLTKLLLLTAYCPLTTNWIGGGV